MDKVYYRAHINLWVAHFTIHWQRKTICMHMEHYTFMDMQFRLNPIVIKLLISMALEGGGAPDPPPML